MHLNFCPSDDTFRNRTLPSRFPPRPPITGTCNCELSGHQRWLLQAKGHSRRQISCIIAILQLHTLPIYRHDRPNAMQFMQVCHHERLLHAESAIVCRFVQLPRYKQTKQCGLSKVIRRHETLRLKHMDSRLLTRNASHIFIPWYANTLHHIVDEASPSGKVAG